MHHGSQIEVVVHLKTVASQPPPPGSASNAPPPHLGPGELARAERDPKSAPRTDGIYAGEPVCDARAGWSRRFLRFFHDGKVRQVDGNETLKRAFRNSADGSPWVMPEGPYKVIGRRVSARIVEDRNRDPPGPSWYLDGMLTNDGLSAMSGSARRAAAPVHFSFTPMK
jgi:hypothetical protein